MAIKISAFNPLDALNAVDGILGRFISDADERERVVASIRIALANRTPSWAQGVAVVVTVVGFNLYLLATAFSAPLWGKYVPWQYDLVVMWFALIAMLYGEKLGEVIKLMKALIQLGAEKLKQRRSR